MPKKDELYLLINSLTRSEKRYFKVFCGEGGTDTNYMRLFDEIDSQHPYNEKQIREKFQNEAFVRQLHVTKYYLRQLILKSLRNYYAGHSRDAELKDMLRNVEILFNKELYDHCERELSRAESLAKTYELNTGWVEVSGWKRKLEQVRNPSHYEAFLSHLQEQKKALDNLINEHQYWQLAIQLSGNPEDMNISKYARLLEHPANALTLEAKVLHYNALYIRELRQENNNKAKKVLYELISHLEQHEERLSENPAIYISTGNNLVSFLVFEKEYEEALTQIEKIRHFYETWNTGRESRNVLKQIIRTFNIELEIYRDQKVFEKKADFIAYIDAFVAEHQDKLPKEYLLSFWFQLASVYFMRKDLRGAHRMINFILNEKFPGIRPDLQIQARLLNLMIHFEERNMFVLRYFVDSTRRFMKRNKNIDPYEELLLKFFSTIGNVPASEYKYRFTELKNQLFSKEQPVVPGHILDYIDYKKWISDNLRK